MPTNKIQLGQFGEKIAANYLTKKGYQIIARNYHTREGEIDLVCQKDEVIVFVEVKTRTSRRFGWPEEAVTEEKLEKMAMTAEKYIEENRINSEWQIDIISIIANRTAKTARINHLKNIDSRPFNG